MLLARGVNATRLQSNSLATCYGCRLERISGSRVDRTRCQCKSFIQRWPVCFDVGFELEGYVQIVAAGRMTMFNKICHNVIC